MKKHSLRRWLSHHWYRLGWQFYRLKCWLFHRYNVVVGHAFGYDNNN